MGSSPRQSAVCRHALGTLGVLLVAVLGVPALACVQQAPPAANPPPAATSPDEAPLADSLRAFALHMAELLRVRDADGVIALYGDTARFVHVDNGEIVPWSRLAPMMRTFFATARENPITVVGEPGVVVMGRDHAVVVVVHRAQRQGEAPHEGVWTGVLHRDGGKWRIVHSHSSDRPQAGMDPHR